MVFPCSFLQNQPLPRGNGQWRLGNAESMGLVWAETQVERGRFGRLEVSRGHHWPICDYVGNLWKLFISRGQEIGWCWLVMRRNHRREILDVPDRSPILSFQTDNTHRLPQWLDGNSTFQLPRAKSSLRFLWLLCLFLIPCPTCQITLLTLFNYNQNQTASCRVQDSHLVWATSILSSDDHTGFKKKKKKRI